MQDKVLIVHQNADFIVDSLINNLMRSGLEASAPSVSEALAIQREKATTVLIFAGEYIKTSRHIITALYEHCIEKEIPICVVGYDKDIALVQDLVPSQAITSLFVRPFEMKELTAKLLKLAAYRAPEPVKHSLLLVDDDTLFLKTMLKFLSDTYDVTAVRSGAHALKFLQTHTPDLIMLDHDMPEMNGPQTLEKLRKDSRLAEIPVIFLTGMSDRSSVVTAMQMKPDGYLLKNMPKDELLRAIKTFFVAKNWKTLI